MLNTAFQLYLVFLASWLLHLPARLPILGVLRMDLLLVCIIAALVSAGSSGETNREPTRTHRIILILMAYVVLAAPLVEWPGSVIKNGLPLLIKASVFYYFTRALCTTEQRLRKLLFVFVVCQAIRVIEPLYLHLTEDYWGSAASMADWEMMDRLSGAPSDVINPNGLAFVILTVIPFAHYLWTLRRWGSFAYALLLPALLYTLLLTASRSGIVGLAAVFGIIWLRSQRKVLLATVLAIVVTGAVPLMNAQQLDRVWSIVDSHTKNAATAQGRVEGWQREFAAAMRRPLFGHGLGTSVEVNFHFTGRDQPSHNLYVEVLEETGIIGLALVIWLIASVLTTVRHALRHLSESPAPSAFLTRLCMAVQAFTMMNVLFSFFSYGLTSYEWYFLAGLSTAISGLLQTNAVAQPKQMNAVRPVGSIAAPAPALGSRA